MAEALRSTHEDLDLCSTKECDKEVNVGSFSISGLQRMRSGYISVHLPWMVLWKCSIFLIKRKKQQHRIQKSEGLQLLLLQRLIHCKTVGVQPEADGKGVVIVMKCRSSQCKPATLYMRNTINRNAPATLCSIRSMIQKKKIQKNMIQSIALIRESRPSSEPVPSCEAQKPVVVKRKWTCPTKSS